MPNLSRVTPACPECETRHSLVVGKTWARQDGTTSRKRDCQGCGVVFQTIEIPVVHLKAVRELAEAGLTAEKRRHRGYRSVTRVLKSMRLGR